MSFANVVTAQEFCFPLGDVQKIFKALKECDLDQRELELRREQDALKDQRIANLEKELELAKQEIVLKDKIGEVKDMEIQATRRALADMEKITDRAIKLVEVSKPKSNWELYGLLGMAAFVVGHLIAK